MALTKYNSSWVGIDSGREGLWKEPLWTGVLKIIASHVGDMVYDRSSPIYVDLERCYPKEAWRSKTAEGEFRPLFRDYPNSWTRTGVVSLAGQRFDITETGRNLLAGKVSKQEILVEMFKGHQEKLEDGSGFEKPFSILAHAFIESDRPLKTEDVYWCVMKNYRPKIDNLKEVLKKKIPIINQKPDRTPYRRLRNMLSLMRASGMIESTRRGQSTYWSALDNSLLNKLSQG